GRHGRICSTSQNVINVTSCDIGKARNPCNQTFGPPCMYRPISLLSSLNKIIEKLISMQLSEYLEGNGLLSDSQFGFRRGHSCMAAARGLMEKISDAQGHGSSAVAIFVDL